MAQISQSERDVIDEYPLNNTLDQFRNILRDANPSFTSGSTFRHQPTLNGPEKPRLFTEATSRILGSLMGSEVAINFPSKIGDEDLASDLLALCRRVQKGDYDYNYFRVFSRLVIDSVFDIDV